MAKCLLIADDLTGSADTGVQFAKLGLNTLLITVKDQGTVDFSRYKERDVLVVNTISRGLSPKEAFSTVTGVLEGYPKEIFSIVYKKIDSTLRGNIGFEIDAIFIKTNLSLCFMAPSYPEQNRTLVDGILMVEGYPLALTEISRDTVSPVKESNVQKLLEKQSSYKIGRIGLTDVASTPERLWEGVGKEKIKGNQIIIFDAVTRKDLTNIADVAFRLDRIPLLVGSAGLAQEVAKKISPLKMEKMSDSPCRGVKPIDHIFIVSGSMSDVTHEQLNRIERNGRVPSYEISSSIIYDDIAKRETEIKNISLIIGKSLAQGHVLLKTCSRKLLPEGASDLPLHLQITKILSQIVLSALKSSKVELQGLALVLTGGDTAQAVIDRLGAEGIEIESELLEGIVRGHLIGGNWDGLSTITKAGAFGKYDALEKIMSILTTGGMNGGGRMK